MVGWLFWIEEKASLWKKGAKSLHFQNVFKPRNLKKGQTLGLLGAFIASYNINVLVSKYQSLYMLCIILLVIFDGGLSISVLRNKQLFKKKRKFWSKISKTEFEMWNVDSQVFGLLWTIHPIGKSLTALGCHFSCERGRPPTFRFYMAIDAFSIYRLLARKVGLLGWIAVFDTITISRFLGVSCSIYGCIQHKIAWF
jgi:hypothetical protein